MKPNFDPFIQFQDHIFSDQPIQTDGYHNQKIYET
jgi:hypothetical protein